MVAQTIHIPEAEINQAVAQGLCGDSPKRLPSWMLYDQVGDRLFQEITTLPEYYPTRCEHEILTAHKEDFVQYFNEGRKQFTLIELGPGDGKKTEILLSALSKSNAHFIYSPVDISSHALGALSSRLSIDHPSLDLQPIHAGYEDALDQVPVSKRKVLLFLGANIGNMSFNEASDFLSVTSRKLAKRDVMLIGFDLKKDPRIIYQAYDDSRCVTRNFNLNVLQRINKTLGANFDLSQFSHYPSYDPENGTASSYLVSLKDQNVHISALGKTIHFMQWETIHTEISQKYDLLMIEKMLTNANFEIADLFFDREHYFCDVVAIRQ